MCQAGEVCVYEDGLPICKDATTLTPPDSCTIVPANVYMATGSTAEMHVTGALESGALTPNASFTLSADSVVTVSGNTVTGTCTESEACTTTVVASSVLAFQTAANVTVFPAVA